MTFRISTPIFGARRLIFFLPASESPECVPPAYYPESRQYNHQINLKNSSRGSLPATSELLTRLSAPYINEGKPARPWFPQQLLTVIPPSSSCDMFCSSCAGEPAYPWMYERSESQNGVSKLGLEITSWSKTTIKTSKHLGVELINVTVRTHGLRQITSGRFKSQTGLTHMWIAWV